MLDDHNGLSLTAKEIELIESALHTQKKILSVQSEAGGSGARQKLSDLQRLMKRVRRAAPERDTAQTCSWGNVLRSMLGYGERCSQYR